MGAAGLGGGAEALEAQSMSEKSGSWPVEKRFDEEEWLWAGVHGEGEDTFLSEVGVADHEVGLCEPHPYVPL